MVFKKYIRVNVSESSLCEVTSLKQKRTSINNIFEETKP